MVLTLLSGLAGQENTTVTGKSDSADTSRSSNSTGKVDAEGTTVTEEVAPAVEHETVKKQHETQEQTVIDKERHQDHYHTTVQPLKDREVKATKEDEVTAERQYKNVDHRDSGVKDKVHDRADGFDDTTVEQNSEVKTQAPTLTGEHVHHHLHETIQPVIEKGPFNLLSVIFESSWVLTTPSYRRNRAELGYTQDYPGHGTPSRGRR